MILWLRKGGSLPPCPCLTASPGASPLLLSCSQTGIHTTSSSGPPACRQQVEELLRILFFMREQGVISGGAFGTRARGTPLQTCSPNKQASRGTPWGVQRAVWTERAAGPGSKEGGCSLPARGRRTPLLHLARGSPSWPSDRATSGRHLPPTWMKWPDILIGLSRLLKLITAEGIVWPCLAGMGMLSASSEFTSCKSG